MGNDRHPQALRRVSVKAIGGFFVAAVLLVISGR